ncbi:MAG: arabinogalactan endo-1,4-beta-galactosidase [Anaerolineaceae bacterium]|nr:arabinogalactan endo-1,4-beta-galactosidase [Anaerolineaceae bacterium]
MRKKSGLLLSLCLIGLILNIPLIVSANRLPELATATKLVASDIHVNPIENLPADFIMGADVSMLKQIEDSGGKFYDKGVEKDCLTILKEHGVNWIRLRLWNDPTDADGKFLGGGNNNLVNTVVMAARAKALGFKFLLDFHYSDWWADPGKQTIPKAWVGLNLKDLEVAVYEYTSEVMQTLVKAGAMPDMVQIGNEVNGGMLWPTGKTWKEGTEEIGGYDGFASLLKSGIQAVRDNDPQNNDPAKRAKIVIHLANGGDNKLYRTVFDALTARQVDYDIIGLSYYSYWHGSLDDLKSNMNDISERYHKDVVIAETAYAVTLNDKDGFPNLFGGEREQYLGGYKATVLGQATAMRDVMEAVAQVPKARGLGIFYWEPDWIAVEGAGWKTGEGDAWENQAMFSFKGEALPSMNVFNLVKPESGSVTIPATISRTYPSKLDMTLGETPTLPTKVKAAFSDDSIRDVPVTWETPDSSVFAKGGETTVQGTVNGADLKAILTITVSTQKNYVANSGFETGTFAPWIVDGDSDAADISKEASNLHSGTYALHYWKGEPFAFTLSQTVMDLPDGKYSLSAWIQGGGGEKTLQLSASDCGGETQTVNIVNTGWLAWNTPTISNLAVSGGKCTINLKVVSDAGSWAFLDDVSLVKVD